MKQLVTSIVVLFFVAGCATPTQRARTEGTAAGAAAGAGLGALTGYLIGGSTTSTVIGAVTGALVGGAAGYAYADRIAKRHEELAGRENDLDARIKFARGVNYDTQEYNESLKRELETLESRINQGKLTKQQLSVEVKDANDQLARAERELQDLRGFRSQQPQKSSELDAEIKKLEETVAQIKGNTTALAALDQRI